MSISTAPHSSVPVLITWDIDPDQWMPFERRQRALHSLLEMCQCHGIPATFYVTAQTAQEYAADFVEMRARGHEIGCHGLTHEDDENYDRMPAETQRDYISRATERLQAVLGAPVRAFRSPRVKTSAQTLQLLAEQGQQVSVEAKFPQSLNTKHPPGGKMPVDRNPLDDLARRLAPLP